jgi:hypothetical protein
MGSHTPPAHRGASRRGMTFHSLSVVGISAIRLCENLRDLRETILRETILRDLYYRTWFIKYFFGVIPNFFRNAAMKWLGLV